MSGPNGAGKTIYLKQLGLLVYLAHLGFYLPAQLAEVPLVDRIAMLVKTPSVYSKDCGLKAELIALATVFSKGINLTNIGMITNKSLVLIDELGLEIDYHYAVKLLYATVCALLRPTFPKNGLLQQQTDEFQIPLSVIITHHSSVLQQNQP